MQDALQNLMMGFSVGLTPQALLYAFTGCVIGTLVGMLPGVGPLAGISLLLPITYGLNPIYGIILLAGVYYGAMYGGSTTSILMRIPGEAASVMTCVDGYAMTQQGRAGPALAIAAIGSFIAGTLSIVGLMLLAPILSEFALRFGPPEYAALLLLGIFMLAYMSTSSMLKMLAMSVFGLLLGMIGIDAMTGHSRFTFDIVALGDGIGIVPVAVGLFGISEILMTATDDAAKKPVTPKLRDLVPSGSDLRQSAGPIARGSLLGFLIGIIPGSAHVISSFMSYGIEKKLSKHPEKFGHGAIEGVAGPESANNAAATGAFVPMLALGLPTSPITAVMLAALIIHGIVPGPNSDPGAAATVLGRDRQHVYRQCRSADPEPPDDRAVRESAAHPLFLSLSRASSASAWSAFIACRTTSWMCGSPSWPARSATRSARCNMT